MKAPHILFPLVAFVLFSCGPRDIENLASESLFSLQLGRLEDQVDLIQLPGVPFSAENNIVMRDGRFFVANGNASKVMEFTSFGDIITLYYDEDSNPSPILLSADPAEGETVNRRAIPYPFRELGNIAVNSRDMLLAEDVLPTSRWEREGEDGILVYNRVVLRFGQDGNYRDFLGRNGVGGDPFPAIERIQTNARDEIVVMSVVPDGFRIYWFTPDGTLLYPIEIPQRGLPLPSVDGVTALIESVHIDVDNPWFYLKADYFVPRPGEAGLQFIQSVVHRFDAGTGNLLGSIDVPKNTVNVGVEATQEVASEALYLLLGVAKGGVMVLFSPSFGDEFRLTLLDREGQVVEDVNLDLDMRGDPLFYSMFHLSDEGILSGLLCRRFEAEMVWWRTDSLIRKYGDEDSR